MAATTYEGVNVMMNTQAARYLLKQIKIAMKGGKCEGFFSYINDTQTLLK
jgi:hypothetical protein